jgi:hypothetical protein
MSRWAPVVCGVLLASVVSQAVQPRLDRRAIEEAIFLAESHLDAERLAFHRPYRLPAPGSPVDWIDVITPFHRVELAAEVAHQAGTRFGQYEALQLLSATPEQLDFLIELTFHPFNTFVGVPAYVVVLVRPDGRRLEPTWLDRVPRFGQRLGSAVPVYPAAGGAAGVGTGQAVTGGTIVASFDLARLDPAGVYDVLVEGDGRGLARARVDLAAMR